MHARRLPRLNTDPYREEYENSSYTKNKFRAFNQHSTDSPECEGGGSPMFNKGFRDREYKYRKPNREDRDRSPRDKNWGYKEKPREKESERLTTFGDWSEHKSSSGKRYYYNCKTEVSQWEKPRDWADFERSRQSSNDKRPDWSERSGINSEGRGGVETRGDGRGGGEGRGGEGRGGEGRGGEGRGGEGRGGEGRGGGEGRREDENSRATPAKLHCDRTLRGSKDKHSSSPLSCRLGRDRSGDATPTSEGEGGGPVLGTPQGHNHHSYPGGPVSQYSGSSVSQYSGNSMSQFSGNSMSQYPSTSMSQYPPVSQYPGGAVSLYPGGAVSLSAAIPRISTQHSSGLSKERWESPRSTISQSPTSSSEQTLQQAVLSPLQHLHTTAVTLTPSLARLHREDLISHVQGWPAEQVERGCHRLTEEAHQISSHGITRVSAELKMARSLVRLAEIQATLQEQRILFLKQQMLDMEKYSCISEPEPNSHTIPDSTEHR